MVSRFSVIRLCEAPLRTSIYHALRLNITKRLSDGFSLQGAYTYSQAIDDGADPLIPITNNILFPPYPRDSFDLRAERGNSEFDVTHRLVVNYSWQLPLGRANDHSPGGVAGALIRGWSVSGITTFSSGLPFDIFTPEDTQHAGLVSRPNLNTGVTIPPSSDPRTQTGPSIALVSIAPFGSAGNLGRNHFRGPGINNFDVVLGKQVGNSTCVLNSTISSTACSLLSPTIFWPTQPSSATPLRKRCGRTLALARVRFSWARGSASKEHLSAVATIS